MSKIAQTIQKLLALSTSDNEHEAKLALQKAHELMLKYNIESVDDAQTDCVEQVLMPNKGKTLSHHYMHLATALAGHHRVEVFRSRRGNISNLLIVGHKQDIRMFVIVFSFVQTFYEASFKKFLNEFKPVRDSRSESLRLKNSYLHGFTEGVVQAIEEMENKYALVLTTPPDVESFINDSLKVRQVVSSTLVTADKAHQGTALHRGRIDGCKAMESKNRLE